MTAYPKPPHGRLAGTISDAIRRVGLHAQQIITLQSGVAALTPGSWELVTLQNGWSNVTGYIPAQCRILQHGMSQVIGNIQGGTIADGTVIGTLDPGFFNATYAHTFDAVAVTGAAAVAAPGTVSSNTQVPSSDHMFTVTLPTDLIPTTDHTFSSLPVVLGPSGQQIQNIPGTSTGSVGLGPTSGNQFSNNVAGTPTATPVNYNKPCIKVDTSGNLTIFNFDSNVTEIAFHHQLPLVTA